jgi:5-methyltetrahydrofolate--homocysteine methyltransferase
MAMFLSVDAVLVNPLDQSITAAIKAAEVILGRDRHCRRYTRAHRLGLFQ